MTHEIATQRLRLRPLGNRDLIQIHKIWIDTCVRRYLWNGVVISWHRAQQEIDHSQKLFGSHGFGLWVLLPKITEFPRAGPRPRQALAGFCGLRFIEESGDVELLYGLKPTHWGKGYATEASRAVLKRAFEAHKLEQVLAITDFPNKASVRLMERLGMQFVERSIANGLETLTYAISREQFVQAGSVIE